jgi:hypothetical protein
MNGFVSGASNPNDCVQAITPVPVASCPVHSNETAAIRKKGKCVDASPRRRSNRDINVRHHPFQHSIRGVIIMLLKRSIGYVFSYPVFIEY